MRYRLPLWQPTTSKYLCASYCASCSCDSHSLRSLRPRCSLVLGRRYHSRKPRAKSKQAAAGRRSWPLASQSSVTNTNRVLAAYEPRKKQGLLYGRIKRARHDRLSRSETGCRREASTRQCLEAALGLQDSLHVLRIEVVPSIAVVVHDDLGCHRYAPSVGRQNKAIAKCHIARKVPPRPSSRASQARYLPA